MAEQPSSEDLRKLKIEAETLRESASELEAFIARMEARRSRITDPEFREAVDRLTKEGTEILFSLREVLRGRDEQLEDA